MKYICVAVLLFASCTPKKGDPPNPDLLSHLSPDIGWTTYEGTWRTETGVHRIELSLQNNFSSFEDASYQLSERNASKESASGTFSRGKFTSYNLPDNQSGIRLLDLKPSPYASPFRVQEFKLLESSEEMYFVTRGTNELLPADKNFVPLTIDPKSTLHKVLNYFTIEGYITFNEDSVDYFEKNTMQYWKVTDLGEIEKARSLYKQLTKEKYEGLYLRGLAYSVADSLTKTQQALVIKTIRAAGSDFDKQKTY